VWGYSVQPLPNHFGLLFNITNVDQSQRKFFVHFFLFTAILLIFVLKNFSKVLKRFSYFLSWS